MSNFNPEQYRKEMDKIESVEKVLLSSVRQSVCIDILIHEGKRNDSAVKTSF